MEKLTHLIQFLLAFLLFWFVRAGYLPQWGHAQPDDELTVAHMSPGAIIGLGHAQPDDELTFSVSCRDANLRDVLGNLSTQKGLNIAGLDVIPETLTVTINLNAVPYEIGLSALLAPNGFTFEKRGNIYFIQHKPLTNSNLSLNRSDGKLTIDANETDVNQVIRALAHAGVDITAAADLGGHITAYIHDQPLDTALPLLFADFTLHRTDGIYRIEPLDSLEPIGLTIMIVDGRISMTARDVRFTQLLSELADRANINLSIIGEIERQMTLRLDNRTVSELLTDLAKMTGYTYRQVGDLHFFGAPEIKPDEMNPLIQRKTLWLKHLQAGEVLNLLPTHIPKQHITVSAAHNTVTIVGSLRLIQETEQFLFELDIASDPIRTRQPGGAIAIHVDSQTQRLTVDILNAPLFDVIRQLAIQTGTDMMFLGVDGEPRALKTEASSQPDLMANTVTLRRTDATLETVLAALFLGSSYTYKWTHGHQDEIPMLIIGRGVTAPFAEEELIALNHLDVVKVMELLPATPDVIITPLLSRNAVLAAGTGEKIGAFRESLQQIDVPQPQAMIQLYLIELTHGNRDALGLGIDTALDRTTIQIDDGVGVNFDALGRVPGAFRAQLTALVEENRGKVLANPSVAVVNGQQASIDIGGKHLFETHNPIYPTISGTFQPGQSPVDGSGGITTFSGYPPSTIRSHFTIETGIRLELTPSIGASGTVTMDIRLSIRDADALSREASSLSQRLMQTTISVPDRGMVVIGGLLQEKETQQVSQVPILHRLPLLGKFLFTSQETTVEQTELIVIIQPKVIQR